MRSLFALVALCAVVCWLGLSVYRVHQRERLLDSLDARGAMFGRVLPDVPPKGLPAIWRLLGATPIGLIEVPDDVVSGDELKWIAAIFPEAVVRSRAPRIDQPLMMLERSPNGRRR